MRCWIRGLVLSAAIGAAAEAPGAAPAEICDGVDNDGDGAVDERFARGASTWYRDRDHDGFGDVRLTVRGCEQPAGYAAAPGDCDDAAAGVHPEAEEVCDGVDNDCDARVDEPGAVGAPTWYLDADGDGHGDPGAGVAACEAPPGAVPSDRDCDDADASIAPGAVEVCDGIDNNCDGAADADAYGGCEEACGDGVDNDGDGLIDCEDATCAGDATCFEDCEDGVDNDGDGLADCEDDECAGPNCHPGGVYVTVQGGLMYENIVETRIDSGYYAMGGTWITPRYTYETHDARVESVWGTVQVLPPGFADFDSTAARSTCQWSYASGELYFRVNEYAIDYGGYGSHYSIGDTERAGFHVESGCRLGSSWFLPEAVAPRDGDGWIEGWHDEHLHSYYWGPQWFEGARLDYTSEYERSSSSAGSETWSRSVTTIDRVDELGPASSPVFMEP